MNGIHEIARTWVIHIMLVCAGIVTALLAAEILVALLLPQQVRMATSPASFFLEYDPDIGWVNRAGAEGVSGTARDVGAFNVRINSLGYRGKEVAVPKPAEVRRIAFLGDSNTFGYGVQEGQRFSDILAQHQPASTEIVNLGVFGYGTEQEAIYLERHALGLSPDMVVLAVSAGDLSDVMSSINAGAAKPFCRMIDGRFTMHNIPVPASTPLLSSRSLKSRTKVLLYRHSHLYRLMLSRIIALNPYMFDTVREMDEKEGFGVMVEIVRGMDRVCREKGIPFKVLLISHGEWIEGMKKDGSAAIGYYAPLKAALLASGLDVIDTTDSFVAWKGEPLFFEKDAVHLTATGNRLVAELLGEELF